MRSAGICFALLVMLAPCAISGQAMAEEQKSSAIDSADRLFRIGEFAQAGEQFAKIAADRPDDYSATLQLGRIALLSNRLDDAEHWLNRAIDLRPGDADPKVMLAEAYYRRDDLERAVAALNGVDVGTNPLVARQYPTLNVAKLQSFKDQTPYEVHGDGQITRLKFLRTDPLPLITVRVNGGDEVTFFIDTGGSEVALDTDFAKERGVPRFGTVQGTFSGGQHAEVQQGRIESLTVGDWTVKNLPVAILPLRQLSEGLGAKQIDGIIGTTLFYHFLATLDFPHGELVLRRKNATNLEQFVAASGKSVAVPFWIAGDHFMVGWGRRDASTCASLRRHRAGWRGSQVGRVGDQGSRDQAGGRQSFRGGGWRRKADDRALRRASPFVRESAGRECRRALRWAVPLGEPLWLPPRGHGRPRRSQSCSPQRPLTFR
jgi:Tfp pilus assembly protein PilF